MAKLLSPEMLEAVRSYMLRVETDVLLKLNTGDHGKKLSLIHI